MSSVCSPPTAYCLLPTAYCPSELSRTAAKPWLKVHHEAE
jgi:hypothetical protein